MSIPHVASYHKGHPNPMCYREKYTSLNGKWKFMFDFHNEGCLHHYEQNFPKDCLSILVPYPYQSIKSGLHQDNLNCDVIWYERNFLIHSLDVVNKLTFLGVDYHASIYINGVLVTMHEGGYDSFAINVTPFVQLGENKLTIRVEDSMHIDQIRGKQCWREKPFACFYTPSSGIYKDVYLESIHLNHIESFTLKGDYASKSLKVQLQTSCSSSLVSFVISTIEGEIIYTNQQEIGKEAQILMSLPSIKPYSAKTPTLYNVVIQLEKNGVCCDKIYTYVGFMTLQSKYKHFMINGEDTYLKMVLDQGYFDDTLNSPTEEQIKFDTIKMKEYGFNGVRKHEHMSSPLAYYYLDIYGLYAFQEHPSTYGYSYQSEKSYENQMVRAYYDHCSHPCIIGYVLFNESWGINEIIDTPCVQDFTINMYHLFKKLAPDKFIISNDGWEHTISDIVTFHNYAANYDDLKSVLNESLDALFSQKNAVCSGNHFFFVKDYHYEGQPVVFSEFAGIAFDKDTKTGWGYGGAVKDEEAFITRYASQLKFIKEQSNIRGFCMTQLTDVFQEKNGLLTFDRKDKVSPSAIADLHDLFI